MANKPWRRPLPSSVAQAETQVVCVRALNTILNHLCYINVETLSVAEKSIAILASDALGIMLYTNELNQLTRDSGEGEED